MKRFLGVILAVLASANFASAALLVHYDFAGGTQTPLTYVNAESFDSSQTNWPTSNVTNDAISSNLSSTAPTLSTLANSNGKYYLGADNGNFATLESFEFQIKKNNVSSLGEVRYNAFYRLVTLDQDDNIVGGAYAAFGPSSTTTTSSTYQTVSLSGPPLPLTLGNGTYIEVVVNAWRQSGSGANNVAVAGIDNVKFHGSVVPEPASMAIFAVLGLPVALKRFRRK
jgi:hypothetical protein